MSCVIVAGGEVDHKLLAEVLAGADTVIAADRGLEALQQAKVCPDYIIGDFDSASEATRARLAEYEKQPSAQVIRLQPEKDDTDSEAALQLAFAHSTGDIVLLGGTGRRIDHLLANISILGQGLAHGRQVILQDSWNRIRMIASGCTIRRDEQYGTYISLFPYSTRVEGLTLEGFKYPLHNATLEGFNSLGVSNELVKDEGVITFTRGTLIVVESID